MNQSFPIKDGKPSLLVVEDDFEYQKLIEIYLSRKFTIFLCDKEDSFRNQIRKKHFDAFLIDISIGWKNDVLQLVKELRALRKYNNVPIVCISAHVFAKDRINAINAGVDEFFSKPVRTEEMLKSLISLCNSKNGAQLS